MSKTYVVIPVHNRWEYTKACLTSIVGQLPAEQVMVVDDGSIDGTWEGLSGEFPGVERIRGNGCLWWAGATNLGIRNTLGNAHANDYILTLNNDTVLPPGYFAKLEELTERFPRTLLGTVALDAGEPDRVIEAGVRLNWLTAKYRYPNAGASYQELLRRDPGFFTPNVLPGRGTAIPCRAFEKVGFYDEKRFPQYAADYDFSLRCRKQGYRLAVCYALSLLSYPRLSGLANTDERVSLKTFLASLRSLRSANRIDIRLSFGMSHAPLLLKPSFCALDIARVIGGGLLKRTRF